jgi:DNA-binding transcriptional regulator YdaS (Cro superfamily)
MSDDRSPFKYELDVALATTQMTQTKLALKLGVPPSTLNGWTLGIGKAPRDLARKIEKALGLTDNTLPDPPRMKET